MGLYSRDLEGCAMALDYRAYPILYVDTDDRNLAAFRRDMEPDFSVIVAKAGKDALRLIADHDVAVLLANGQLPEMSGVELCRRAREVRPNALCMVLTSPADPPLDADVGQASQHATITRYLFKPCLHDELSEILRTAVDMVHAQRAVQSIELRLADSAQAAAASSLSDELVHEFSNPLGALELNANLVSDLLNSVLEDETLSTETRDALAIASEAHADSVAALDQLKSIVSRVRQGRDSSPPPQPGLCYVARVVEATVRIVRAEIEPIARLTVGLDASPTAAIDASVLGQVVLNLLLNAAQAVHSHGGSGHAIAVGVSVNETHAQITIEDDGPGIAPPNLERIFDPFFTTKQKGSGLGLAICRDLLAQAHGTLTAESVPDRGARFVVSLPLVRSE
jgi:signal transduction histidine kinase